MVIWESQQNDEAGNPVNSLALYESEKESWETELRLSVHRTP